MFEQDENEQVAQLMVDNKALFVTDGNTKLPDETNEGLEPTLDNLMKALNSPKVGTKKFHHEASNMNFTLCAMSSAGYTALNNVELYNQPGTIKISTNPQDERERNIIYLTHGVAKPKLSRTMAESILDAPGWGPSNIALVDAIILINPSSDTRVNSFMLLMGLARFNIISHIINADSGAWDKYCDENNLKPEVRQSYIESLFMFSKLFNIHETAEAWGFPLSSLKNPYLPPIVPPLLENEEMMVPLEEKPATKRKSKNAENGEAEVKEE